MTEQVDRAWQDRARGLLRAELARRGIGFRELAERLREIGIVETEKNLSNKISRGTFSAAFLLQCMSVLGVRNIRLGDDDS